MNQNFVRYAIVAGSAFALGWTFKQTETRIDWAGSPMVLESCHYGDGLERLNGDECVMTGQQEMARSDVEIGFRSDGIVVWRKRVPRK